MIRALRGLQLSGSDCCLRPAASSDAGAAGDRDRVEEKYSGILPNPDSHCSRSVRRPGAAASAETTRNQSAPVE
eukprot:2304235-Pyramimonas_sp.AAC.1